MGLQEKPMNWNDDNADAAAKDAYCKIDGHNAQLKCKVSDHAPFMPPPARYTSHPPARRTRCTVDAVQQLSEVRGAHAQWFRKTVAERVEWCKKGTGEREAMDANCGPYQ